MAIKKPMKLVMAAIIGFGFFYLFLTGMNAILDEAKVNPWILVGIGVIGVIMVYKLFKVKVL
jgi:divalent metal cation (Fe/Co/Zn/Cd) transporter